MRIISGKYNGRQIHAPGNLPVRPTTDFAKTGLFNILQHKIDFESIAVLDLFCGTGNITYEFASRGCTDITSVDADRRCVRFVKETLEKLGAKARVLQADVFRFLSSADGPYDLVFADPPYELDKTSTIPVLVKNGQLLKEGGWLIIEHPSKTKLESEWEPVEVRTYGNCAFSIYR